MAQTSIELVKTVVQALEDKKAEDITILDISKVSVMADYFIIASGNNMNQVHALCDNVEKIMLQTGIHCQTEGYQNGNWILMDYGDFIVHIFDKENRFFYDLERIWRDGKEIKLEELM